MSFFLFFPSSFFPASTRQRYTRELRVPTEFYSQVFLYFLMAKFHWRRAISQWQSKRSDEMEFTPLYLSLKLNLFISKSRNELLLPRPIGRFPPRVKAWNGAKSLELSGPSTFLLTINAIDARREIDSIRERERRKRFSKSRFRFHGRPCSPVFSFPWKDLEKSRQNRREETQFVEMGSNSRPRSSFVSLSPLFHLFLSRYFHSDHEVYLSRCAAKVRYF